MAQPKKKIYTSSQSTVKNEADAVIDTVISATRKLRQEESKFKSHRGNLAKS